MLGSWYLLYTYVIEVGKSKVTRVTEVIEVKWVT